jgi:uncharacterized alpha-E superfamily protein
MLSAADSVAAEVQGFSPDAPARIWHEIESILAAIASPSNQLSTAAQCHRFLLDWSEPMSVAASVRNARENTRAFRDVLSLEAFTLMNATWRRLQMLSESIACPSETGAGAPPIVLRSALDEMQTAIFAVCGAIDRTAVRGDAWRFLHMGTVLERGLRTSAALRVVLPGIRTETDLAPVRYARMRALLRSLAALEGYHCEYGAMLDVNQLFAYLMFNPAPPHSLLACVEAIDRDLDTLGRRTHDEDPARRAGLLLARLRFEGGVAAIAEPVQLAEDVGAALSELHHSITEQFFTV